MRWGNKCISRDREWRRLALLWVEIFEAYFREKSGTRLAVAVGDGARYWIAFLGSGSYL
jgi:hypothetical protein